MNKEDKELLLRDLCARIPYGIKVEVKYYDNVWRLLAVYANGTTYVTRDIEDSIETYFEDCKPYLFPMSSMTEEQKREYQYITERWMYDPSYSISDSIDWLNKNRFDPGGLIPKGLAKDATGLNIY